MKRSGTSLLTSVVGIAFVLCCAPQVLALNVVIVEPADHSSFGLDDSCWFWAVLSDFGDTEYEYWWYFYDTLEIEGGTYHNDPLKNEPVGITTYHTFSTPGRWTAGIVAREVKTGVTSWHEIGFAVIDAQLKSIEFTSDHHVMTDTTNTVLDDSGQVYNKPEWTAQGANNPISQTMGTTLAANVSADVEPAEELYTLRGDPEGQTSGFALVAGPLQAGPGTVFEVTGTSPLDNQTLRRARKINWSVEMAGYSGRIATVPEQSGQHMVFTTFGQPAGPGTPTYARVNWTLSKCSGTSDPFRDVEGIFSGCAFDAASFRANPWSIAAGQAGDCRSIANLCESAAAKIGVPGTGSVVYLYPAVTKSTIEDTACFKNVRRSIDIPPHSADTIHNAVTHSQDTIFPTEWLMYYDKQGHGPMPFQACYKYTDGGTTKYYAGGVGIFDDPMSVMNAEVSCTAWCYWTRDIITGNYYPHPCRPPDDGPGPFPQRDWTQP